MSSLSPAAAAAAKVSASALCAFDEDLYWIEGRPELGGAKVVVRWKARKTTAEVISPNGLSLGSRVHDYGGGELCVTEQRGPLIVGVRSADQAIVSFRPGDDTETVELEPIEGERRGALCAHGAKLVFVAEHIATDGAGTEQITRSLAGLDLRSHERFELASGRDFYANPVFCEDGDEVAFLCWDHPEMAWEAAELWLAEVAGLEVRACTQVAGGLGAPVSSPVFGQPIGTMPFHALCWLQEIDGFNRPVMEKFELGLGGLDHGGPIWGLGEHHLVTCGDRRFAHGQIAGVSRLFEVTDDAEVDLGVEGTSITTLAAYGVDGEVRVAWLGATPDALGAVGWIEPATGERALIELGAPSPLAPVERSRVRGIEVDGPQGRIGALVFEPPGVEAPYPGVLLCHGGPTGMARAGYDPLVQLLTSNGFCVVAPNFAGSTGFGAEVRHRLDGQWGVADVADCVAVAEALIAEGLLAEGHLGIRGTSSGGMTALLASISGRFAAVCSWYGVADLLTLAHESHGYEAHYSDRLIGSLPAAEALYVKRSPVTRAPEMEGAFLLLQGTDDPIVPAAQAEAMAAALKAAGQEVDLRFFEGESHGFRRLETLTEAYEAELAFYQRHLGHEPK